MSATPSTLRDRGSVPGRALQAGTVKLTFSRKILRWGTALVLISFTALSLGACTSGDKNHNGSTVSATSDSSTSSLVTTAPLETPSTTQSLPVYWLGHSNESVYLYREFLAESSADEPIVASLKAMMSEKPQDPDYFSAWNNPSRLGASISAKNVITVDISADAFGQKVDQGIAERSISQLVYTATAAASMAGLTDPTSPMQVSILVDGHTGYNAFGHVALDAPLTRNSEFVAPVWIIDPANGSNYKKMPLKVTGQGISNTGVLAWTLTTVKDGGAGEVHQSGTVNLSAGPKKLDTFNFTISPPPGTYLLSIFIADPATPGGQIGLDTKEFILAGS